jgi:hypothetical protein
MDAGLGFGVFVGLCMLRLAHCLVGDDSLPGEDNFEVLMVVVVVVVLRMAEGACMVFLRMEVGFGLFGDRIDNGSGLSMAVDSCFYRCRNCRGCKQTNPIKP